MGVPTLGGLGGGVNLLNTATQAIKNGGKNADDITGLIAAFFKKEENKTNLIGGNGKSGVLKGFTDLFRGMSPGNIDSLLKHLQTGLKMPTDAFGQFSSAMKGKDFSSIPFEQLLAAGKYLFNMVS